MSGTHAGFGERGPTIGSEPWPKGKPDPIPVPRPCPDLPTGTVPEALGRFAVVIELPVLWSDQDAMGHVNNTVPIRWFESARLAYLEQDGIDRLLADAGLGPILAAVSCNFRRQLHYPDRILVGIRVVRVGRTSLAMEHVIWSRRLEEVAAEGDSTCVAIDYADGRPRPIPDAVRSAIARLEKTDQP
jgi:acyl-CoA thioester hydrolase